MSAKHNRKMELGHALPSRQRGAVLVVGLIVLLVLLLLGLSYAQSGLMQGRMAGNMKDLSVAFQSSEAGLRWPAAWLQSLGGNTLSRPFPCVGECDASAKVLALGNVSSRPQPKDDFWEISKAFGVNPADNSDMGHSVPMVAAQPRFTIEQQYFRRDDLAGNPQLGVAYYRVTAMGKGKRSGSDSVVRAVLAKRFE